MSPSHPRTVGRSTGSCQRASCRSTARRGQRLPPCVPSGGTSVLITRSKRARDMSSSSAVGDDAEALCPARLPKRGATTGLEAGSVGVIAMLALARAPRARLQLGWCSRRNRSCCALVCARWPWWVWCVATALAGSLCDGGADRCGWLWTDMDGSVASTNSAFV